MNTAPTFSKKVTAVTGVTGKAIYTEAVTSVTSVARKKYKTRYIITAPTFQKNAFMNIAPTFAETVIKNEYCSHLKEQ